MLPYEGTESSSEFLYPRVDGSSDTCRHREGKCEEECILCL